ncbi:methionyl-tRNA formyltransferase [Cumulibacter manganitolerans]|uniref:methionyl-tRNA formyltransferase n=1 Tax=Cumulibacter manganitolerans TaxID=1884992 RepID=UPI001294D758|nr:methionyl-tRNA formyltransferase [Cumulibacter manganitolerans]
MRILFAGTPRAAVPSLEALHGSPHEVVAVLTRPDTRAGRGRGQHRSEVGLRADELGIPLLQPRSLREPEAVQQIAACGAELAVIVAYGGLVPPEALAVPPHGWVNLHFSLLPRWRGAAPVQHAIAAGDEEIGACTFRLEEGLDTGPVYRELSIPMPPRATSGELLQTLALDGAALLRSTVDDIAAGTAQAVPQPDEGVTLAPKLSVADAQVHFAQDAMVVDRMVRAATPAPGAWFTLGGVRLKLGPVEPLNENLPAGELVVTKHDVVIGCATGAVRLGQVQPQGKRPMAAADYARGARLSSGMLVDEASL